MKALWTQSELRDVFAANPSERLNTTVTGVSIDTRTLQPGDLFFAIEGETRDGHD
jgi:UDP-N-acetylmuramoyl-tripeptide--D-alanyl-D-alanine ligase